MKIASRLPRPNPPRAAAPKLAQLRQERFARQAERGEVELVYLRDGIQFAGADEPNSERLPTITGAATYRTDYEIRVKWIVPPTISRDGRLRLKVRVMDDSLTPYPDGASDGNGLDVNIVGHSRGGRMSLPHAMHGEIRPPARPGCNWGSLDETQFVADVFAFDFSARTLTLKVLTNPRLAGAEEICASRWTNPPRDETPTWVNRERVRREESRRE